MNKAQQSKEIKVPCKVNIVTRQCECGGEMQRVLSSTTTLEYPLMYLHECSRCGNTERFTKSYPYPIYLYDLPEVKND